MEIKNQVIYVKIFTKFVENSLVMNMLYTRTFETPLGKMVAFANQDALLLLDFEDSKYFDKHMDEISQGYGVIKTTSNKVLKLLEKELKQYFKGKLTKFSVPVEFTGTDFQKKVWEELQNINFGEYRSYQSQADAMKRPKSVRAVANANSRNKLCLVVPCHRVIGKNLSLTGYAGGVERKATLLKLEGIELEF